LLNAAKLALGTAQFGLHYGIANEAGRVPLETIEKILERAWGAGVNTLDTAIAYGDAENQLGLAGVSKWRVISKLPSISSEISDVAGWVDSQTDGSLDRLQRDQLSGLLLHRARDLLGNRGEHIQSALQKIKEDGRVKKIGVSIYDFDELRRILDRYTIDIVQVPFNCIDRRLVQSGSLSRLSKMNIEVHVRSIFLQGLLVMQRDERPDYFMRWRSLFDIWDRWIADHGIHPVEASLSLPIAFSEIDRIVVGVDDLDQLNQILDLAKLRGPLPPTSLACDDLNLINPTMWGRL